MIRIVLAMIVCMSARTWAENETNSVTPPLSSDVVMQIDDWNVPTDWFLHEFRSTFFRHTGATNLRDAVFAPFRNRMILHAKARADGIDQNPELKKAIEQRILTMRAFMEYQLAMVQIDMVNEAMVKQLDITTTPETVTDEEVTRFFEENIKQRPGAPSTIDGVPPHIMSSIKVQTAQFIMEKKLENLIAEWETGMAITINREAIQEVPLPEMKGQVPAASDPR